MVRAPKFARKVPVSVCTGKMVGNRFHNVTGIMPAVYSDVFIRAMTNFADVYIILYYDSNSYKSPKMRRDEKKLAKLYDFFNNTLTLNRTEVFYVAFSFQRSHEDGISYSQFRKVGISTSSFCLVFTFISSYFLVVSFSKYTKNNDAILLNNNVKKEISLTISVE